MFNFNLTNPNISNFLNGDGDPPVTEFLYLHKHPFIRPNFLTDIEFILRQACDKAIKDNVPAESYIPMLTEHGVILGSNIEEPDEEKVKLILNSIKTLYKFAREVLNEDKS